jgi:serine protease inhibitor
MHWNSFLKGCGWLLAGIFLIAAPSSAGGLPAPPIAPSAMGQGFALELFKTLCQLQPKINILTSPLSVYSALMMTASGARGATLMAMANVLQMDPAERTPAENQICAYLAQAGQGDGSATFHLANAIWTARGTPIENAYVTRMTEQYRTIVRALPQDDPIGTINSWVSEQTHGKIDRIIERIDPNLALLIINAAYFKDAWQTPFPITATTEGPFYLDDGGTQSVSYMARCGQFDYLARNGLLAIRIPYQDPRFCMLVLLPPIKTPLGAFIASLAPVRMNGWRQRMIRAEGRVVLPRFQMSRGYSLRQPLVKMGMGVAFNGEQADFSGITPTRPFAISDVNHRCLLKVDEAGSEAAAVTAVEMFGSALPSTAPFEFVANRPFLCLLEDRSAGRILFMAAVYRPESP